MIPKVVIPMPTREDTYVVTLKCSGDQVDAYTEASEEAGMSRQAWCKAILDAGAGLPLSEHLARARKAAAKLRAAAG